MNPKRRIKLHCNIPESDETSLGELFKAFCDSQKEGDSFTINDKRLALLYSFRTGGEEIIEAISDLPFQYVVDLTIEFVRDPAEDEGKNDEVPETEGETETSEEAAATEQVADNEEATATTDETGNPKRRLSHRKVEEIDERGKQVFEGCAKESESFDDFVRRIGAFIRNTDTYAEYYSNMVDGACSIEEATIPKIEAFLKERSIPFDEKKRSGFSMKVKDAFGDIGSNVRLVNFLREIAKYKNYDFAAHTDEASEPTVEASEPADETSEPADETSEPDTVTNLGTNEDESHKEYKFFDEKLVEKLEGVNDFSTRVDLMIAWVRSSMDGSFYEENHDKFITLLTTVASDVKNGEKFSEALFSDANEILGPKAHLAKAFIFQLIKELAVLSGATSETLYDDFFEDLNNLL